MTKLIFIFSLFSISLFGQNSKVSSEANINNFIKDYFINEVDSIDLEKLDKYCNINHKQFKQLDSEQKKKFRDYLMILINLKHQDLKACDYRYKLLSDNEIDKNLLKDYRLVYTGKLNIYYITCNNKVVTHFITDDSNKITSFSADVFNTHNGRVEPYFLDNIK